MSARAKKRRSADERSREEEKIVSGNDGNEK